MALTAYAVTTTPTALSLPTVTAPSTGNAITSMMICNYSGALDNISIWAVPSGFSNSNTNIIVYQLAVPAGETVSLDQEKLVLGSGDAIYVSAKTSSTALSIVVSTLPV